MKKILFLIMICVLIFTSCNNKNLTENNLNITPTKNFLEESKTSEKEIETKTSEIPTKNIVEESKISVEEKNPVEIVTEKLDPIEEKIKNMTIEEKIGQLFIVAFRKDNSNKPYLKGNDYIKGIIKKYNLGGVILFGENIETKKQTINFINDLQSYSNEPLFIAVDEEGGIVSRIGKLYDKKIDKPSVLGKKTSEEIYNTATEISNRLNELGFNLNFAPVADINSNPQNTVIGERAFGNSPEEVSKAIKEYIKSFRENNIGSVLKHYPGHGDTKNDTHFETAIVNKNIDELKAMELIPFKKGIDFGANGILVAHVTVPNVTKNNEPAIFSKYLLTDILRDEFNFKGLIITDALDMKAITNNYSSEDVALKCFKAGVDILLMPEDLEKSYNGILNSYKENKISEEEINKKLYRILKTKENLNLI